MISWEGKKVWLFSTILSFSSKLAREFSFAKLGKFVQSLHSFCSNWLLSKNQPVQNENCQKVMLFRWHWVFSCAVLSEVSWATLHRVFVCAMLSQEYYHIIEQDFFMWKCFLEALGQHCTRFLHLQCCPKTINPLMPGGNKKVTDT